MVKKNDAPKYEIAVFALASMGGAHRAVYTEDIAVKCYELAPSRFSWRLEKYKKNGWPDKYIVKTALEDAKKEKYGSLVDGQYALETSRDGWRLTAEGANWLKRNKKRIEKVVGELSSPLTLEKNVESRFLKKIRAQPLFKKFIKLKNLNGSTQYELRDMLSCSPDTAGEIIIEKFDRLVATAQLSGDNEIIRFFEACKIEFDDLLKG